MVLNPFTEGRSGGSTVGPAIGYAPQSSPQSKVSQGAAQAFASVRDPSAPTFDQRYGFWASGYGGNGNASMEASGSTTTTTKVYGYASGLDYRVTPDTTVGFALGGGGTSWNLSQGLGGGHSDMFQSSLYASTHFGAAYLSGAVAYSWNDVKTNRTVTVSGTDMLAGHFDSNTLAARMEAGYRFDLAGFGVTPYTAGQVQWMFLPSYAESATSGSNQFALSYTSQTIAAERTELGSWFDYDLPAQPKCQHETVRPRGVGARLQHQHERNRALPVVAGRKFCGQRAQAGGQRRADYRRRRIQTRQRLVGARQVRRRIFSY